MSDRDPHGLYDPRSDDPQAEYEYTQAHSPEPNSAEADLLLQRALIDEIKRRYYLRTALQLDSIFGRNRPYAP